MSGSSWQQLAAAARAAAGGGKSGTAGGGMGSQQQHHRRACTITVTSSLAAARNSGTRRPSCDLQKQPVRQGDRRVWAAVRNAAGGRHAHSTKACPAPPTCPAAHRLGQPMERLPVGCAGEG